MTKFRVAILGLVAGVVMLVVAIPAMAHSSRAASTITVTAGKPSVFAFTLSSKSAKHGAVTFKVKNAGTLPHDFSINGKKTKVLSAGASASLTVTFKKAGSYPYKCTVPGHAAAGMKGTFKVT